MRETELSKDYLHHVGDEDLGERITASLRQAEAHRQEIAETLGRHLPDYKHKVEEMSKFFKQWIKDCFSSQEQQD